MTPETRLLTAAALRQEFDESFAEPPRLAADDTRDYVLVRVGDRSCALPAKQLRGIEHRTHVAPVPSSSVALMGIAGVRGALVPVFALAPLLGWGPAASQPDGVSTFACVALSPAPDAPSLGLAFDDLLAFARVESRHRFASPARHSPGNVLFDDLFVAELDLRSLVGEITGQPDPSSQAVEDQHG